MPTRRRDRSRPSRGSDGLSWWDLISVIVRHGGEATLTQAEDESGWSRTSVHKTVRRLITRGLVAETFRHEIRVGRRRRVAVLVLGPELIALRPTLERLEIALR